MSGDGTTDYARAVAFLNAYGDRVRYSPELKSWFVWDGKRWEPDVMRHTATMAMNIGLCGNDGAQENFLKQVSKMADVKVGAKAWDANPWLMACENVTVDLRTGAVKAPAPEDLNTKLANVVYDTAAECPTWVRFLTQIMDGSDVMVAYLQRLLGYCLTGHVGDAILPFFIGDGANGKSTLLRVIQTIMGDYTGTASEGLLLAAKYQGHPTALASLMGRRLVVASEMPPGRKLDIARVKQLTGGDTISARFMHGNEFVFNPTHKLIVQCNHLPRMGDATSSAWRRVQRIEFPVVIPEWERDRHLDDKLLAESSGILNWLIVGSREWAENGLRVPPEVAEATEQYRQADDVNAGFFEDSCEFGAAGTRTANADLLRAYNQWAERNVPYGDRWSQHDLYRQAEVRGATRSKWSKGRIRGLNGLRILTGDSQSEF